MTDKFKHIKWIKGEIPLPGDKSISHRALIFSAMADGKSRIENLSDGADVKSTMDCLMKAGAGINRTSDGITVNGVGFRGFKKPDAPLDCGNSGTTARLLSGLLAAQNFSSELRGDTSLSVRPMKRIIDPLRMMGAAIDSTAEYTLPLRINPVKDLFPIDYDLKIPSAQIKSAILIAGLHMEGETTVTEYTVTRDHTENMLGLKRSFTDGKIISASSRADYPASDEYFIPGDISSASFLIAAALISRNSELIIRNISLNRTRTAILEVFKKMGGRIEVTNSRVTGNEERGDIAVLSSDLRNITIRDEVIAALIDEIPVLAVAGAYAEGRFEIRNCGELRFKESDRIKSICANLRNAGIEAEEYKDGFGFEGNPSGEEMRFESFGDHRIAMAFAVMAMLNEKGGSVSGFDSVGISNPGFMKQIKTVATFS